MDTQNYIESYLLGTATKEESEQLLRWIKESETNKQEFEEACKLWYSLNTNKFDEKKAFSKFANSHKARKIALWEKISAVAAVLIIAIACFSIFRQSNIDAITITNNEYAIQAVTLPDNSIIYLQKNASVSYPKTFAKNKREISTSGNVFCEIFHNESAPFTLTNKELAVTVLGTSFQVNETDSIFVVVETGKVKVSSDNQSVTIIKGERADFSNGKLTTSQNNDVNYLAWKTKFLQFDNTKLSTVYNDLTRCYNYTFDLSNLHKDINTYKLTGSYKDLNLQQTLTLIEMTIPDFQYSIQDSVVIVSEK